MFRLNKIIREIDKILALLGCIIAPIFAFYTQVIIDTPVYTVAVVLSFFACLTYLYLKKDFLNVSQLPQIQANFSIYLILNIFFYFYLPVACLYYTLDPRSM